MILNYFQIKKPVDSENRKKSMQGEVHHFLLSFPAMLSG